MITHFLGYNTNSYKDHKSPVINKVPEEKIEEPGSADGNREIEEEPVWRNSLLEEEEEVDDESDEEQYEEEDIDEDEE
jgi:hypothetical protein